MHILRDIAEIGRSVTELKNDYGVDVFFVYIRFDR